MRPFKGMLQTGVISAYTRDGRPDGSQTARASHRHAHRGTSRPECRLSLAGPLATWRHLAGSGGGLAASGRRRLRRCSPIAGS